MGGSSEFDASDFYLLRVTHARYAFEQTGYAGYWGMGPGDKEWYTDPRLRSMAIQLKENRRINNLVAAFYTCGTDTPQVKYGGWKTHEANI